MRTLSFFSSRLAVVATFAAVSTSVMASSSNGPGCPMNPNWRMPHKVGVNEPALDEGMQYYAFQHFGQVVGNGQCADLPDTYLRSAHAKTFYQLGPADLNANYVWGNLVTTATPGRVDLSEVIPGDIIQLRDVNVVEQLGNTTWTKNAAHHTAVVFAISPDNQELCVFEQNPGPVNFGYYDLRGLRGGTMWFYRPVY